MSKALVIILAGVALFAAAAQAGNIAPALQDQLAQTPADQPISVIVHLQDQAPVLAISQDLTQRKATRHQRHEEIVRALQDAARSQDALASDLDSAKASGDVMGYTRYWIANVMVVQAVPAAIERMAARADVAYIERNFTPELIKPVDEYSAYNGDESELDTRGIGMTPGLPAINVPQVWNELGIDGSGALIGSLDTGVDADHPAISTRWRGNVAPHEECWLDVIGSDPDYPSDFNSHGTHTVGTMCGLAPDDTIGVAPGAMWIAVNAIDQGANDDFDNDIIECFQWFADPDGDPSTSADVPDVVQNSWGVHEGFTGYYDCDSRWWAVIDHCEAAGVVVTWSAGNEAYDGLRSPADRATTFYNVFSVGSTQHTYPYAISSFSSRGPSTCPDILNPALAIKPEVSAPGSDIYSSLPGGSYGYKSGTSMAGPHVAGVVALMRAANPDLEVELVKQILMQTAVDLGNPGEDNDYGWGIIDAYEAVRQSMEGFGSIEGTVSNTLMGDAPLPGARVELPDRGYGFTTDGDGFYGGMAAPGEHTLVCSLDGFQAIETTAFVYEDQVTVQSFALLDIAGPAISNVSQPVATADIAGPYTIEATLFDHSTVASASLNWRLADGGWTVVPMALAGDVYTADIPGQPANSAIEYTVSAVDGAALENISEVFELVITASAYATQAEDPGDPDWTMGLPGDDASAGLWERVDPIGTIYETSIVIQPEDDHTADPGVACYVTGNGTVGGTPGEADVDDGCTTLVTPVFDLSTADRAFVSYWRWFAQDGFTVDDDFVVEATNDGAAWVEVERISGNHNAWTQVVVDLGALANGGFALTDQIQLRFLACDTGGGGLIEVAIDDFEITVYEEGGVTAVGDDLPITPAAVVLRQNHPNPFNPSTTIGFALPQTAAVDLAVYTIDGRRVTTMVNETMPAGQHSVTWQGRDDGGRQMASGTYFYRLVVDGQPLVKRMVLVK